jgi:hypothetical protein
MKKAKTFRGDKSKRRVYKRGCNCFFCLGYDKDKLIKLKNIPETDKDLLDEIDEYFNPEV